MRVKRGVTAQKRHKKIRKLAKGYRLRNRTTFRTAKQAVMKAGMHAYRDRRLKKRTFRNLWIVRLNAALRAHGTTYSKFIYAMGQKGVLLNRKALSELAVNEPKAFTTLVKQVIGDAAITPTAATGKVYKHEEKARTPKAKKDIERDEKKAASKKAESGKQRAAKSAAKPAKKPVAKKAAKK